MNGDRESVVDAGYDACSNPSFDFYSNSGYINYQCLQGGKLTFGWGQGTWLVNHPSGKVDVEFHPGMPESFASRPVAFTSGHELTEAISGELTREQTTALFQQHSVKFRARVYGDGGYKAYGDLKLLRLINDQLPPLKCVNIIDDKAEFDVDATSPDYVIFTQEPPGGRSGTVAAVIIDAHGMLSAKPVEFHQNSVNKSRTLSIRMSKENMRYFLGKEVLVGCLWNFGEGSEHKEYFSELRKLKITGAPVQAS